MAQKRNGTRVPIDLDTEAAFHESCATAEGLKTLLALYEQGEVGAGDLSKYAGTSQSSTSQRLAKMRLRGIVVRRRDAQQQFYSLHQDYRDAVAQVAERVGGKP